VSDEVSVFVAVCPLVLGLGQADLDAPEPAAQLAHLLDHVRLV